MKGAVQKQDLGVFIFIERIRKLTITLIFRIDVFRC